MLHFTLPFKTPFKTKQLALEVFDPSLLRRLRAAEERSDHAWSARPPTCTLAIQRPTDGTATAQKLNEQTFMNGDNSNFGAMFANKITVDCP